MKKNYLYSALFAAALTLGFTSCSSNDDANNVIGEEDVIKTQDDVYALINGAYRPYQTLSSTFTSMVDTPTELGTSPPRRASISRGAATGAPTSSPAPVRLPPRSRKSSTRRKAWPRSATA